MKFSLSLFTIAAMVNGNFQNHVASAFVPSQRLSLPSVAFQPASHISQYSAIESHLNMKNNRDDDNINFFKSVPEQIGKGLTSTLLLFSLFLNTPQFTTDMASNDVQLDFHPPMAQAAAYGSLTDEQKAVAEAWRIVDNTFIDRSFNHQDWFQVRQDIVKKKYKNMDEARDSISSMVGSLGDKYTRYLPPDKYQSIVNSATGTLAGIGVQIATTPSTSQYPDRVQANDVEEKGPANAAGIKPLDVFYEVDGVNVQKATPDEVAQLVRGPVGSKVGVVMERNGEKLDFILTRDKITVTSVKSYLSGKTGVIRIKNFSGTTATTVSDALSSLKQKGATNFIIDLRGNPGGLLPGGYDTASIFLPENKPVVFVVDKNGVVDSQKTYTTGSDLTSPIAIFVNDQTASASEVFTAALQENERAVVVGDNVDNTFGKGIVQTIRELSNGNGGVAVTLARYETPKHNDINKKGIPVDVKVDACSSTDAAVCIPASVFKAPQYD